MSGRLRKPVVVFLIVIVERVSGFEATATKNPGTLSSPGFSFGVWRGGNLLSRAQTAHYHRRKLVSRSCSGWEGVVPSCCGRHMEWMRQMRDCMHLAQIRMKK